MINCIEIRVDMLFQSRVYQSFLIEFLMSLSRRSNQRWFDFEQVFTPQNKIKSEDYYDTRNSIIKLVFLRFCIAKRSIL